MKKDSYTRDEFERIRKAMDYLYRAIRCIDNIQGTDCYTTGIDREYHRLCKLENIILQENRIREVLKQYGL